MIYIPEPKGEILDEYNYLVKEEKSAFDFLYPELTVFTEKEDVKKFLSFALIFALEEGMRL